MVDGICVFRRTKCALRSLHENGFSEKKPFPTRRVIVGCFPAVTLLEGRSRVRAPKFSCSCSLLFSFVCGLAALAIGGWRICLRRWAVAHERAHVESLLLRDVSRCWCCSFGSCFEALGTSCTCCYFGPPRLAMLGCCAPCFRRKIRQLFPKGTRISGARGWMRACA